MLRCCRPIHYLLNGRGSPSASNIWRFCTTTRYDLVDGSLCALSRPLPRFTSGSLTAAPFRSYGHNPTHTNQVVPSGITEMKAIANQRLSQRLFLVEPHTVEKVSHTTDLPGTEVQAKSDSASLLRHLLSSEHRIEEQDISDVVSAYQRATGSVMAADLFSNLLSLLGSLALPLEEVAIAYRNPLAAKFKSSLSKGELWSWILKIGDDKRRVGYTLDPQDRYWLMMAWLAERRLADPKTREAVEHARGHYDSLKTSTNDPNVHIPFLKFLVLTGNYNRIREAVGMLCAIMQRNPNPDIQFTEFLWEVILLRSPALTEQLKAKITRIIFNRVPSPSHALAISATSTFAAEEIIVGAIHVRDLSRAFATALFPAYRSPLMCDLLGPWAIIRVRQALEPSLPLNVRWNNISLLALALSQHADPEKHLSSMKHFLESKKSTLWQITLMLDILERHIGQVNPDKAGHLYSVQGISLLLWDRFLSIKHEQLPIDVTLTLTAAFLRVASHSLGGQLISNCLHFLQQVRLWANSSATRAQMIDNIAAYAKAFLSCEGPDWPKLYSSISSSSPCVDWQADVTQLLLQHYVRANVAVAYDLYVHSVGNSIEVSPSVLDDLLLALVESERWDIVSIFLKHPTTGPDQIELLFKESIRVCHAQKYEYLDPAFVKLLAESASSICEHRSLPISLRESFRYFLLLMGWTGNTSTLVKLVQASHQTSPTFISTDVLKSLLIWLVRRHQLSLALDLFQLFANARRQSSLLSLDSLRYMLYFYFMRAGAQNLANQLARGRNRGTLSLPRVAARHGPWSRKLPSVAKYFHPDALLEEDFSTDARETVSLLVRIRHYDTAMKLYAKHHSELDPKINTVIGNIILNGIVEGRQFTHGRLVRRVLRTADQLSKECSFVPDQVTVNTILKAILRWTSGFHAKRLRTLFDALVHEGYPVAKQFRRENGVPFSSPPSLSGLNIPSPLHVSFSKHIRPLYKMFIKAFYTRGDVGAAKAVVGILKEEEVRDLEERERRTKAREDGRRKQLMTKRNSSSYNCGYN